MKNANEIIGASEYIVLEPSKYKGKWSEVFGNANPIHIEIGMGKGRFIHENAIKYPNVNFIGIEKYTSVMARAVQRNDFKELPNLKLICIDALMLNDIFDHELDTIYLNFSDPWPKDRHAKRRLTSDVFLALYDNVFKENNKIVMKTDNLNLYNYSKEQFINHQYDIETLEFDINTMPIDNIMTEYESKFLNKGNVIYKIEAIKK